MHTPTLDHTEPRQEGCSCTTWVMCDGCFARFEREWSMLQAQGWLPKLTSGRSTPGVVKLRLVRGGLTLPDPGAPER